MALGTFVPTVRVVTVRLWAAVAEAAGHPHGTELSYRAASVEDLLTRMLSDYGRSFAEVLPICSVLVDGTRVSRAPGATTVALSEGGTVDLLPPYAGG